MSTWSRVRVAFDGGGFGHWRCESGLAGPRVVVFGGTHGDECEGVIAAHRLGEMALGLKAGVVETVPIVHEAAFFADSRTSPLDGRDLARCFPGDPAGGVTQRLAHALHTQVLAGADLLIDLHTSGRNFDIPFLAGFIDDGRDRRGLAARMANAFGAPLVWRHPVRPPGRTLNSVDAAIYTESPCAGPTDLAMVERYVDGCLRVLDAMGMLAAPLAPPIDTPAQRITSGGDVDSDMQAATRSGLFIHRARCGEKVAKDQVIGMVVDRAGRTLEEIRAAGDGWVVVLRRRPHVQAGDRVVAIAHADA
jgi:predicted deacylase